MLAMEAMLRVLTFVKIKLNLLCMRFDVVKPIDKMNIIDTDPIIMSHGSWSCSHICIQCIELRETYAAVEQTYIGVQSPIHSFHFTAFPTLQRPPVLANLIDP